MAKAIFARRGGASWTESVKPFNPKIPITTLRMYFDHPDIVAVRDNDLDILANSVSQLTKKRGRPPLLASDKKTELFSYIQHRDVTNTSMTSNDVGVHIAQTYTNGTTHICETRN